MTSYFEIDYDTNTGDGWTREQQIEHWIRVKGRCERYATNCKPKNCVYKATGKTCSIDNLYEWACQQDGAGVCETIWEDKS